MKIEKIETTVYGDKPLTQLFVTITTDEGLQGTGEAWWGLSVKPVESAVNDTLAPLLIGKDSGRIEFLWHEMYKYAYRYGTEGVILCALSGIDLALWDLLGKRLDVSVAGLMGGPVRESLKAYASLPQLRDREILAREVERSVKAGFAGVKLHEIDIEMVREARNVAPPGFPIMLDVNGHWTPLEAEENAKRLLEFELEWLEEPVWPMQDHGSMAKIRNRTGLPLAAGENEYTLPAFDRLMKSGAVDYVQPEITKIGGLSMAQKISALSDLHNIAVCPHGFRIGPALYANIHWALTQFNMEWLEIPFLPEGRKFASNIRTPEIIQGEVYLPDGPGFGWREKEVQQ